MRASYDSLFGRVKEVLKKDPFSGHLFLFINSKRTSCKCLYYDGTGLVIISKRLERGVFSRINPLYPDEVVLTEAEFGLFFEGSDLGKRFVDSPQEIIKNTKKQAKTAQISCNLNTSAQDSVLRDSRLFIPTRSQSSIRSTQ
jgi:transposase